MTKREPTMGPMARKGTEREESRSTFSEKEGEKLGILEAHNETSTDGGRVRWWFLEMREEEKPQSLFRKAV